MDEARLFVLLLQLGLPVMLLVVGLLAGRANERAHYRSIHRREERFLPVPATATRTLLDSRPVAQARLVTGSVVVSVDYFKRIAAALRALFGGEVRAYSSLLDRGRREALLRMKEQAPTADLFMNVRIETSSISKGREKAVGTIEVLAHATAVRFADEVRSQEARANG